MKITKPAAVKHINSSRSIDAVRVSLDDLNRNQTIKDLQKEIDKRVRGTKDFTIILVDWSSNPSNKNKEKSMNQDLLTNLFQSEIDNEKRMLEKLDQLNLDDISKENIRLRTYDRYKEVSLLTELENA